MAERVDRPDISWLLNSANKISDGNPKTYKIPLTTKRSRGNGYRIYSFGTERSIATDHRVIMLVGETGSGKSTLINCMINYILDVAFTDRFRFKIISRREENNAASQAQSQTQKVVCYTIYPTRGSKLGYTLTIIDTPGFGDPKGIQRDKGIIDQIRDFFTNSRDHHIDHIHAIGFVAPASQARLTPSQRYVFDAVLSLFGKDIKGNIMMMLTFADGQNPAITDAIRDAAIPCSDQFYKFNNSALFAQIVPTQARFDEMFWEMGMSSMTAFFFSLDSLIPKSITLTAEVLKERQKLEINLDGLRRQIQFACSKMEELQKEQKVLEESKSKMEKNQNFAYTVQVTKKKTTKLDRRIATNCTRCAFTCHKPCMCWDFCVWLCDAFTSGYCTVCPGKCPSSSHYVQNFCHEYYTVEERRTYRDLEQKYKTAAGTKATYEQIVRKHQMEADDARKQVMEHFVSLKKIINRLDEIALRQHQHTNLEYIDVLIEDEKRYKSPGWQLRVQSMENMKANQHLMQAIDTLLPNYSY